MSDKLTDEQAAEQFIWLTNTAGTELQLLAGGTVHAPAFSKISVEYLRQIADVAKSLADHYKDAEKVEDPALTPIEDMGEEAQKAIKEQEKAEREAEKQAEAEAREQEKEAREAAKQAEHSKPKHI
jgi:cobalamin biosynthesis protein CobT